MDSYLIKKREEVLKSIKPKLNAFGIDDKDYDYILIKNENGYYNEELRIYDTFIGCDSNSIFAVEMEVLKFLNVVIFCRHSGFTFNKQLKNYCKRYWKVK